MATPTRVSEATRNSAAIRVIEPPNYITLCWCTDSHIKASAVEHPENESISGPRYLYTSKQGVQQFADYVDTLKPELAIHTGDIADGSELHNSYAHFMECWNSITNTHTRKEFVIGNHDIHGLYNRNDCARDLKRSGKTAIAGSKFNQSFSCRNGLNAVRVIMVDSTRYNDEDATYSGYCPQAVRDWIAAELATCAETNVLMFMHSAPPEYNILSGSDPVFIKADADALYAVVQAAIAARPGLRVTCFTGHDHGWGELVTKTTYPNFTCYVGGSGIADYAPGIIGNGGFFVVKIYADRFEFTKIDKVYPYPAS